MQLEIYKPKGFLSNIVESITFLHGSGTGVAFQRMYQVIIINLGTNFHVSKIYQANSTDDEHTDTIWINGKQETPLMIENRGVTAMYVIGIKAGMLPYLAGIPAIETNNLAVGAQNWASNHIFFLREQLLECADIQTGFRLIEQYLINLLRKKDFTLLEKLQWMDKAIHSCTVADICRSLGVSRKKLRSETQHYFGGSVKNIQGILRFNNTLATIVQQQQQSLSSIHPYYDQSHFINDFKARSGITPLQYKKLCRLYPALRYTPNFIPMEKETFLQFISAPAE